MSNNINTPRLRFPEFSGEWEEKKLGEVCKKIVDGSHNPPQGVVFSTNYLLSSQNVQDGYIDYSNVRYLSNEDYAKENQRTNIEAGDVLLTIVGTIGRCCVVKGNEGNVTFQRSVAILKPKDSVNSYYLLYCLQIANKRLNSFAAGGAQKGIYLKQLENFTIPYFALPEQQKIAECLTAMDNLISAQAQKVDALKEKKKGLMQQLFPQPGQTTPKLRFPGFTGEWEEKPFGELYEKHNVKNDLSFGIDKIISVANMYYKGDAAVGDDDYLKTYNVFRLGDIAYEGHKSAQYEYGRFVANSIGDGIVSHIFDVYSPKAKEHSFGYWKYVINYERIMRPVLEKSTKQSTMMNNLVERDFLKQKISVPSLPEQQKIAECLSALDEQIAAESAKVEALKDHKKGLMQQMFPIGK